MDTLKRLMVALQPLASPVDARERTRAALGAALGIAFTALLSHASWRWWGGPLWLTAPIGASAVLVFVLPASPLAQPWAVVAGNAISVVAAWVCALWIPDTAWAASAAVALAIVLMFLGRCLHPPGGGVAVLAVLAQSSMPSSVSSPHLGSVFWPVVVNSALMVAAGMVYNNLTGRRYPHAQQTAAAGSPAPAATSPNATRFTAADFDAALAHYNQVIDMSRDDLEALLQKAEAAATQRTLGSLRCADIMSSPAISVPPTATPMQAQTLMVQRSIKALPVVDEAQQVVGIVSAVDLVRRGTDMPTLEGLMTRPAQTVSTRQWVTELLPVYSEQGHHHLPVVDDQQRLVGMVTQSDLVRALHRAVA